MNKLMRIIMNRPRFRKGDEGSIAMMSALFLSMILAGAGFAFDAGSLRIEKQSAQTAADIAAIVAAANMDKAQIAAEKSIAANKIEGIVKVTVTKGRYTPDAVLAPAARFQPNAVPINAVQVKLKKTGKQYFSQMFTSNPMTINVAGVAATNAETTFSLGSTLVNVSNAAVPNRLLTGLLGGNVQLSVNDYQALEGADVSTYDFLNSLAAAMNVTSGTYQQLLDRAATVGDVLTAIATAASDNGDAAAAAAVNALKAQSNDQTLALALNNLIDLGTAANLNLGETSSALTASFNALELINGAAKTANAGRTVAIDLNSVVPGLISLKLDMVLGEPPPQTPWVRVGQSEATITQAASRIRLVAEVGGSGLLAGVKLKLPIYMTLGQSRARLDALACAGGDLNNSSVTIGTQAGAAEAWIGEVTNAAFSNMAATPTVADATIANVLLLVKITGKANVKLSNVHEMPLVFDYDDIQDQTAKSTTGGFGGNDAYGAS